MRTIWKLRFDGPELVCDLPLNSRIIHVDEQEGNVCLWVVVDTEFRSETRTFKAFTTGVVIPNWDESTFIGTVVIHQYKMVWHIFELHKKEDK